MSNSLRPYRLQPARLLCLWGFTGQEYWSVPCLPPGGLHCPGIEPESLTSPALAGRSFTTCTAWEHALHLNTMSCFLSQGLYHLSTSSKSTHGNGRIISPNFPNSSRPLKLRLYYSDRFISLLHLALKMEHLNLSVISPKCSQAGMDLK